MREWKKHLIRFVVVSFIFCAVVLVAGFSFSVHAHAQSIGGTLPSVPAGVSATIVPPSQVSLSWNASTESSGTIEDYYVYRNGTQIGTTGGTLFVDTGLTSGLYQYTVAAVDANGNVSAQSSVANVSFVVDTTPPTVPTGVTITGVTSTNSAYAQIPVVISWSASTDNVGVSGYRLYRSGILLTTSTAPYTATSYSDTITPGTYWYTVVAYDATGNSSNQSTSTAFTVNVYNGAPSTPTNISVQQTSATGVNVSWASSTDNIGIGGYQVYRNSVQIASAAGSPYADTGLSIYNSYSYAVAAYDTVGNVSGQSAPVTITIQSVAGPSTPDIITATPGTSTVKLLWAIDADVLPITGYQLYRNGTQIASVTSTNYLDQGLASGTYVYALTATDVSGAVSTSSPAVSATVSPMNFVSPVGSVSSALVVPSVISVVASSSAAGTSTTFTQSLHFGLRGAQVQSLQSLLVANGYLSPINATGFFGNLTLHALEKFQCDQKIVCTGGGGWGLVGPKTRTVLNSMGGNNMGSSTELQSLEAELANLEKQL